MQCLCRRAVTVPEVVKTVPSTGYHLRKGRPAKEIVVNTKYDKCSDPMYRHLVYSSELDVFLTAKRGKVWLERLYARNMAAARELQDRQTAATEQSVPIALQYLYGGSAVVQGDANIQQREEVIIILISLLFIFVEILEYQCCGAGPILTGSGSGSRLRLRKTQFL